VIMMLFECKTRKYPKYPYIVEISLKRIDHCFRPTGWMPLLEKHMLDMGYPCKTSEGEKWFIDHLNGRRGCVPGCNLGLFFRDLEAAEYANKIIGTTTDPDSRYAYETKYSYEEYFKSQKRPWKIL